MFKMKKSSEEIDAMFSWFQIIVTRLDVLEKSYTTTNHANKILRSMQSDGDPQSILFYRPKIRTTLH